VGVVLATLRPYAALRDFYRDRAALLHWGVDPEPDVAGHIREVAVLPEFRRASMATRLLARSEATLGGSGAACRSRRTRKREAIPTSPSRTTPDPMVRAGHARTNALRAPRLPLLDDNGAFHLRMD